MVRIICAPCRGLGHICTAEVDLDGDLPKCMPCHLGQDCAKKKAKKNGHSDPVKDVADIAKEVNRCQCKPDCDAEAKPGKQYAWGHKPKAQGRAPVISTAVNNAPAAASSVPFDIEVLTEDEYTAKYTAARWANPQIMALFAWLDNFSADKIAAVKVPDGDTATRFKDRIERTFKNYCKDKPYTLDLGQEGKLGHVRIKKVLKESAVGATA